MEKLSAKEAAEQMLALKDGWDLHEGKLKRRFIFKTFKEAVQFVNKIAEIAEEAAHHPEMEVDYNKVQIKLWTHDVKGLTAKDFEVAKAIDAL